MSGIKEKKIELEAVETHLECDCGGEMLVISKNMVCPTNPFTYLYKCEKCGKEEYHQGLYPHIEFRKKQEAT